MTKTIRIVLSLPSLLRPLQEDNKLTLQDIDDNVSGYVCNETLHPLGVAMENAVSMASV